jgi:hypothetical protein
MSAGPRPPKTDRGSTRRVRRITLRGNWSIEVWIVIGVLLITLFVVVPLLIRHPADDVPFTAPNVERN